MKKYNLNKLVNLIYILVFMVLILILIINIINIKNQKNIEEEKSQEKEVEITNELSYKGERVEEGVITPEKSYLFFAQYTGKITNVDAYNAFYNMAGKLIPEYYKNMRNYTQEQINEYYNLNKESIIESLGIYNSQDFTKLINKTKKLNGDSIKLQNYKFASSTIQSNKDTTSADLIIQYEGNNELILNITLLGEKEKAILKVNI